MGGRHHDLAGTTRDGRNGLVLRRLAAYWTGKGAVSAFGEAALGRALADSEWVKAQLSRLREPGPSRAKDWHVMRSSGSGSR